MSFHKSKYSGKSSGKRLRRLLMMMLKLRNSLAKKSQLNNLPNSNQILSNLKLYKISSKNN